MCFCIISTEILFEHHKANSPKETAENTAKKAKSQNIKYIQPFLLEPEAKMQQEAPCFVGSSPGEQEQSYSEGGHWSNT